MRVPLDQKFFHCAVLWVTSAANGFVFFCFVLFFVFFASHFRSVWPLSLLAFRRAAHSFSLDSRPTVVQQDLMQTLTSKKCTTHDETQKDFTDVPEKSCTNRQSTAARISNGQHESLGHCYRRHVNPKKQHEILYLSQVCACACVSEFKMHQVCNEDCIGVLFLVASGYRTGDRPHTLYECH